MTTVFKRTPVLKDCPTHYCPGCGHGIAHRLLAEVLDELDVQDRTIGIAPVGCAVLAYNYLDVDMVEVAHGRAPAVATGMKRTNPDKIIFSYQGDGDLAAIGTAEIVHAANRGENICVVFVNNAVFGMTGGQMAPTTLEGQVTTTSPYGRSAADAGLPIRMSEMLATLEGAAFVARVAVNNIKNLQQAKKALHRAFEYQVNRWGFSFVEFLSACPTNWKMTPQQANKRVGEEMADYFPLAVFKDRQAL